MLPAAVGSLLLPALHARRGRGVVLDGTVGAGGHAEMLVRAARVGHYVGVDKDAEALEVAFGRLEGVCRERGTRLTLLQGDFREVGRVLEKGGVEVGEGVDVGLLDVGVSSMQLDVGERGFSFMRDGPLDMRMDGGGAGVTAADIVNDGEREVLERIFREFGEEKRWRVMADRVVRGRPFGGTLELAECLAGGKGRGKVHPATLCFQGLRIAVNGELDALERGIGEFVRLCRRGEGRVGVVSFHSLEDRIVKRRFRELGKEVGGVEIITKRPVVAEREECRENVRSRSAKLRVVRRLGEGEKPKGGKVNKYRPET